MRLGRLSVVPMLLLCSCNDQKPSQEEVVPAIPPTVPTPSSTTNVRPTSSPATANYVERDGDRYLYVTAVSDEDKTKGNATGKVVMYQYLGIFQSKYRLRNVAENGQPLTTWECPTPCRIIKSVGIPVQRVPFEPTSIIGAAFEDAIAGRLQPIERDRDDGSPQLAAEEKSASLTFIPANFVGEWNARPKDCGTSLNDSRLLIGPREILFYESRSKVQRVIVKSTQTIDVTASMNGEGRSWTNQYELTLSPSGSELRQGELVRHRCI